MLILLPAASLVALCLALVSRGREWSQSIALTLLGGGLWVWALAEGLSLFAAFGRTWIAVGWAVFLIAAAGAIEVRSLPARFRLPALNRTDSVIVAVAAGLFAFSSGAAFLSAVFGVPNVVDVLEYHLPRVVYWLQSGSVEFFPANYYQLLSLQPMAEYAMAHAFALAGNDRFVQLIPWAAFVGSVCGLSWLASLAGAGLRGQAVVVALAATAPNAVLQASGAKNDLVQAFFLIAAAAFALQAAAKGRKSDAAWAGAAAGLALLTKGTSYAFAPGLAIGVMLGLSGAGRITLLRRVAIIAVIALALNLPHYYRNYSYNGHPLGAGSATETPDTTYANERIDVGVIVSNFLRNAVLQIPVTPDSGEQVYGMVERIHEWMGLDPNDRATTFWVTELRPERDLWRTYHETLTPNLLLTVLLIPMAVWLAWRRRLDTAAGLGIGALLAFVFFCALIKWQPWHARMHTPLQLLACVPIGMMLASVRRPAALLAVAAPAVYMLVPSTLHNQMHPLLGPRSVFVVERFEQYHIRVPDRLASHRQVLDRVAESGCDRVGIDAGRDFLQYPLQIGLLERLPGVRLQQAGLGQPFNTLRPPGWFRDPCVVICLACVGKELPFRQHGVLGPPEQFGKFLVFTRPPDADAKTFGAHWLLDLNGDYVFDPEKESLRWGGPDSIPVVGDWNGDGSTKAGLMGLAAVLWFRDLDGNFQMEHADEAHAWAVPKLIPAEFDLLSGQRQELTGLFSGRMWWLDLQGDGVLRPQFPTPAGDGPPIPIIGDWNGNGRDNIGVYSDGVWFLDRDGDGEFDRKTEEIGWGSVGSIPVVGDWNGDGKDWIGAFRDGYWYLDADGDGVVEAASEEVGWGGEGAVPMPGDWNGDGRTDIGVFKEGVWYVDRDGDGAHDVATEEIGWGGAHFIPVAGDWNGDGNTNIGAVDPTTMIWFLDFNGNFVFDGQEEMRGWGTPGDTPVTGDWNGDGRTKIGVLSAAR